MWLTLYSISYKINWHFFWLCPWLWCLIKKTCLFQRNWTKATAPKFLEIDLLNLRKYKIGCFLYLLWSYSVNCSECLYPSLIHTSFLKKRITNCTMTIVYIFSLLGKIPNIEKKSVTDATYRYVSIHVKSILNILKRVHAKILICLWKMI